MLPNRYGPYSHVVGYLSGGTIGTIDSKVRIVFPGTIANPDPTVIIGIIVTFIDLPYKASLPTRRHVRQRSNLTHTLTFLYKRVKCTLKYI